MLHEIEEVAPIISSETTANRNADREDAAINYPKPSRNRNCVMALFCRIGESLNQILYKLKIKKTRTAARRNDDDDRNSRGRLLQLISWIVAAEERSMGSSETNWVPPPDPMDNSFRSSISTNVRGLQENLYRVAFQPSASPDDDN